MNWIGNPRGNKQVVIVKGGWYVDLMGLTIKLIREIIKGEMLNPTERAVS